jgi:TonB-linked SusC/RagA family outer membrane protein
MKFKLSNILIALMMLLSLSVSAQTRLVQGVVLDKDGEPLIGAGVVVQGTRTGTVTDADGNFQLQAAPGDKLVVSFLGFEDVVVSAATTPLRVVLQDDSNFLNETVVVGYGTQKKATLTGAVSAVNNKEMVVTKNENVINMLSGKVAGVRITQNSSQPGEFDNKIDIRGMGTPLIVVDGVPRDQAYFSRMDANEIESVSVLKDASAAIYGVRAANGVILVTTKHGTSSTEGKFDIDLSANLGWQNFLYVPETADAASHMLLMNEKQFNGFNTNYPIRSVPKYQWDQILEYSSGQKKSTNWADELFMDNAPQEQYNLSVNGSSDKIDYFFNLGYMDQMGSYKSRSLNYNRWNFRSNVDARITERLRASLQLSGYMDEKNQPHTDIWTVYKKAWTYRPTSQAWLDAEHTFPGYDSEMLETDNPVATTDKAFTGYRQEKRYNFNGALALTYDIPGVEGLNVKAFYSYDYYTTNNSSYKRTYSLYSFNPDGSMASFLRNDPGSVNRSTDPSYGTVLQLSTNYDRTFADAHHVSAMLMYEESYNYWDSFYAERVMLFDNQYLFAGESENQIGSMNGVGDMSRRAFIFHGNYDYKSKYILDLAARYDSSSKFPAATRWGFFPSVSAGWRISEEGFVKDNAPWITNLKLRASWGMMGDDASAGTYPATVVGYELRPNDFGWYYDSALTGGVAPTAIPNYNLTWYTATTWNAGLDWSLWRQKFTGTVEVFKRLRSGLLATSSIVLPGTVGASMPQENIESDTTFGYEIQLGHLNKVGELTYWINGQMSATKNRWVYHLDSMAGNSMENWRRGNVSGRNKDIWFSIEEGGRFNSLSEIQQHLTTGTNYSQGTLPGDYWYIDWNEDGVVDGNDSHPVATYNLPVFNYGLTLGFECKGWDFSMNWQGAAGIYNEYSEVFTEVGPFNGGAALDIYKDRWHTANSWDDPWNPATEWIAGYYPATGHSFNTGSTGILNSSYVRLKTLELGYTLPKEWTKAVNIKSLRVYVNGYNLLTFSGMKNIDPERPGTKGGVNTGSNSVLFYNYPVNRTLNVGANIKF